MKVVQLSVVRSNLPLAKPYCLRPSIGGSFTAHWLLFTGSKLRFSWLMFTV
jgi:hypothetical protein